MVSRFLKCTADYTLRFGFTVHLYAISRQVLILVVNRYVLRASIEICDDCRLRYSTLSKNFALLKLFRDKAKISRDRSLLCLPV